MKPPGKVNSGTTVAMLEITGLPNRTALYCFAVGHVNDLVKLMRKHIVVSRCETRLSYIAAATVCAGSAFPVKINGFNLPKGVEQKAL
jgi:hypothetical protein